MGLFIIGALEIPPFSILVAFENYSSSLHLKCNWEFVLASSSKEVTFEVHARGQIKDKCEVYTAYRVCQRFVNLKLVSVNVSVV